MAEIETLEQSQKDMLGDKNKRTSFIVQIFSGKNYCDWSCFCKENSKNSA